MMVTFSECTRAFYSLSLNSIVDLVRPNGNSLHGNKTFDELRSETPDLEMLDFDAAYDRYGKGHIRAPEEITKREFYDAFGCMPPVNVRNGAGSKSFRLSELYAADVASIYCRIGKRYFKLRDRVTADHETIVAQCRAIITS